MGEVFIAVFVFSVHLISAVITNVLKRDNESGDYEQVFDLKTGDSFRMESNKI